MQDYIVEDLRVGDFKDNHGNTWCDVVFKEVGEPVKWVLKDPSKVQVGDSVYGLIEEKESKAGKTYKKFKRGQKPEGEVDWDRKDAMIRYQWAYREALAHFDRTDKKVKLDDIRDLANTLVKMVDEDVNGYLLKESNNE